MTAYRRVLGACCAKGASYLVDMPLPEHVGGGRHVAVVLSPPEYNAKGYAVVAPLRKVRPNSYRCPVYQNEFTPRGGALPLDRDRVLDLGRVASVSIRSLGQKIGTVSSGAIARVENRIPSQYQFDGPWEIRGAVWTLSAQAPVERVALAMNDIALENDSAVQFTALEVTERGVGDKLLMVHSDWLAEEVGALSEIQQEALSDLLASMFGLSRTRRTLCAAS